LESFNPREFVEKFDLVSEAGWQKWVELLRQELRESYIAMGEPIYLVRFAGRLRAYAVWVIRKILRNWVFPMLVEIKRLITSR
jgi:hypothetical protein